MLSARHGRGCTTCLMPALVPASSNRKLTLARHMQRQSIGTQYTIVINGGLAGPAVGVVARAYGFRTVIEIASLVTIFAAAVLLFSLRRYKVSTSSPP